MPERLTSLRMNTEEKILATTGYRLRQGPQFRRADGNAGQPSLADEAVVGKHLVEEAGGTPHTEHLRIGKLLPQRQGGRQYAPDETLAGEQVRAIRIGPVHPAGLHHVRVGQPDVHDQPVMIDAAL